MAIREEFKDAAAATTSRVPHGKLMIFGRPSLLWEGAPTTEDFYRARGYGIVDTMDISAYQGASIIHDLNSEDLPPGLEGEYDEVMFGGTAEHVFNVGHVLRTAARLVKVGGYIDCSAPANNWLDHGFYQLCPTLKTDFFHQNGFELGVSEAILSLPNETPMRRVVPVYPGEAQALNYVPVRILHRLTVRRLAESTWERLPLQSVYVKMHDGRPQRWRFEALMPYDLLGADRLPHPARRIDVAPSLVRHRDGCFAVQFRDADAPPSLPGRPFRSRVLVFEDGELLRWIVSEPGMVGEQPGSFHHAGAFVFFTPSDGSDPRSNGRRYELVIPERWRALEPF